MNDQAPGSKSGPEPERAGAEDSQDARRELHSTLGDTLATMSVHTAHVQAAVQQLLMEHGEYVPLGLLLTTNRLGYEESSSADRSGTSTRGCWSDTWRSGLGPPRVGRCRGRAPGRRTASRGFAEIGEWLTECGSGEDLRPIALALGPCLPGADGPPQWSLLHAVRSRSTTSRSRAIQ